MSGPKCDDFWLSFEEDEEIARAEQERLAREAQRRHEQKLAEQHRRRQEAKRRMEEELQRKMEEQLRQEKEFDEGVDQIMLELELQEFLECVSMYEVAAEAAGIEPIEYELDANSWETQKEEINRQIEELKQIGHAKACKERVNEIIVETMVDMGYEVMAERQVNQGVSMAKLYDYGDDTAISMIAHNGKFTFEVVATDKKDRIVSPGEAMELEKKMQSFCNDYAKLMERLDRDKRLKRQEVFHKPANRKYARVVNSSVYHAVESYSDKSKPVYKKKYGEDYHKEVSDVNRRGNEKGII